MRNIGKNIKDLRIANKLTQEELAEKLFVTRQTVSNYENGKSRPDVDMIVSIAEVLHSDANTVIYGVPVPEGKKTAYRRMIIASAVLGLVITLLSVLHLLLNEWRRNLYRTSPYLILNLLADPIAYLLFGWWLLHGISLLVQFKPLEYPWVKYARILLIAVLVFAIVILIPIIVFLGIADYRVMTHGSVSMVFPYIPIYNEIMELTTKISTRYTVLYALIGAAIRLFEPAGKQR